MLIVIVGALLILWMLLSVSLLKIYRHVPTKELRRQARANDELAKLLYRAVAYGMSLDLLLWIMIGLSSSLFFVLLVRNAPWPIALVTCLVIIWFAFAWLPQSSISKYTMKLVKIVTPPMHWLLEHLQPVLRRISDATKRFHPLEPHTGIYTKEDIVDLIHKQKVQIDNRVTEEELYIVSHVLTFGDKKVNDVMTPSRMIKRVSVVDMIGPVLMGELHDSGHSRFPVFQDNENHIVGTLYLRDAITAKSGGFVKDILRKEVFYVNETQSLARVLDAFIKTKHHLFLVVNNFEEIVGLITLEDIIEQILGKQIIDEFDQYDDLRAVAQMEAEKDRESHETVVESEEVKEELKEETRKKHEDSK